MCLTFLNSSSHKQMDGPDSSTMVAFIAGQKLWELAVKIWLLKGTGHAHKLP